ncbi:MAG: sulfite exporter TauE/SafE family protein [Gemmatimonadetes bacterium]|nr:MAG: sulfite exporter TauE/SafE family protein [Gemmatimonadota bacterium]
MLYPLIFAIIFIASFLFAMLGLGGGMVYVPVLKWAGFSVKEVAIPLGLLLNGLNTLLALIPFARKKLVDWKGGSAMAIAALVCAPIGAYTAQFVPVKQLLILFSIAVLVAAFRMLLFSRNPEPEAMMSLAKRSAIGAGVGALAGFAGGLLGIGGGFIIAPILMWMGYKTKKAAATTAYVVTFSSFSGYLGHMAEGHFNWPLTIGVVIAVIAGSQLGGSFMSTKANPKWVKRIYAVVLLAIAIKLIWGVIAS